MKYSISNLYWNTCHFYIADYCLTIYVLDSERIVLSRVGSFIFSFTSRFEFNVLKFGRSIMADRNADSSRVNYNTCSGLFSLKVSMFAKPTLVMSLACSS